jgi:hypothetical protein
VDAFVRGFLQDALFEELQLATGPAVVGGAAVPQQRFHHQQARFEDLRQLQVEPERNQPRGGRFPSAPSLHSQWKWKGPFDPRPYTSMVLSV